MKLSDFNYHLPGELIAQLPLPCRSESRLMVLHLDRQEIEHRKFYQLTEYLSPGDVLVINDTRVIPARIYAKKKLTGGEVEITLLRKVEESVWEALIHMRGKPQPGQELVLGEGEFTGKILSICPEGCYRIKIFGNGTMENVLERYGEMPLPPYIKRKKENSHLCLLDRERYQTVYARYNGSVAAPTAGLHFTEELLKELKEKGIRLAPITLHVGWGTFRLIRMEEIENHQMYPEYYEVSLENVSIINQAREEDKRVVAVGTTVTRTLETVANSKGKVYPGKGWTNLYIYPGYRFRVINCLVTNFHLPRSTPLMLVCAFAGKDFVLRAYQEAIQQKYRFYSYGDAMLIL